MPSSARSAPRRRGTPSWSGARIYTIGHSTRTIEEFIELLEAFGVLVLVDIRSLPGSRRCPQFNAEALRESLGAAGIAYAHLSKLGGRRRTRPDSPNAGWRNASFRGYADYMLTEDFEAGLSELYETTERGKVTLMCAEAVPWRCHRFLVADVLTVRGAQVEHIVGKRRADLHRLAEFAEVRGQRVVYPAG